MSDTAFGTLVRDHARPAPESTAAEVTERVCRWLRAVEGAGLAARFDRAFEVLVPREPPRLGALLALTGPALAACRAGGAPAGGLAALPGGLERRFGAPLPPSLTAFWELRARSPHWRALFSALTGPEVFDPAAYLDGHDYGPEYRLSVARVGDEVHPVYESLDDDEYGEWFDAAPEADRATAATWRSLRAGDRVMLDPAVALGLVQIASGGGEWVALVGDWRTDDGESPLFRAGDDYEGYAHLLGTSVPQWLGLEVDATMDRLAEADRAAVAPDA
ncbi:hypothetical protein ACWDR0_30065 [Streptomyces sp. NPDC003691]